MSKTHSERILVQTVWCLVASSPYPCMVQQRVDFLLPCCCPHWHGAHPFILLAGKTTRRWKKFLRGFKGRECMRKREGRNNYFCLSVLLLFYCCSPHLLYFTVVAVAQSFSRLLASVLWARYWTPDGCSIGVWVYVWMSIEILWGTLDRKRCFAPD